MKVVVRIRPANQNEKLVVRPVSESQLVFDPHEEPEIGLTDLSRKRRNKNFAFDQVFTEQTSNLEVFEASIKPLIQTVIDGYNCSVFAYGATGSGKTFTMLGREACPGIVYLTVTNLWEKMEALKLDKCYQLAVSYLEIYNEEVKDLLVQDPSARLTLCEDRKTGVNIKGLTRRRFRSLDELLELLRTGNKNRAQHKASSRSHAVFQVFVEKKGTDKYFSKLSLTDLAGSESGSAKEASSARFDEERRNITKSLLALGNCISALAEGQERIPYRDSKLTRILKDGLGGNCQTVMIAAVSPTLKHYDATYNTLLYADRVKKIKITLVKKLPSPTDIKISKLEEEKASLRAFNDELIKKLEKIQSGEVNPTKSVPKEEKEVTTEEEIETCKDSDDSDSDVKVIYQSEDIKRHERKNGQCMLLQPSELGNSWYNSEFQDLRRHKSMSSLGHSSSINRPLLSSHSEVFQNHRSSLLHVTLPEVVHIRTTLIRAEMEKNLDPCIYQEILEGKICYSCKTSFGLLFGPWAQQCYLCKQTVCSKCSFRANIPDTNFPQLPKLNLISVLPGITSEGPASLDSGFILGESSHSAVDGPSSFAGLGANDQWLNRLTKSHSVIISFVCRECRGLLHDLIASAN